MTIQLIGQTDILLLLQLLNLNQHNNLSQKTLLSIHLQLYVMHSVTILQLVFVFQMGELHKSLKKNNRWKWASLEPHHSR